MFQPMEEGIVLTNNIFLNFLMIIILCASLQEGQDKADDDLIIDLVKTASAIMEKKIKDPVLLTSCQGGCNSWNE